MDIGSYLHAIEGETAMLAAAAERDLGAPVPTCPGWAVADLVWHLIEGHGFWADVATRKLTDPRQAVLPVRSGDDDLIDRLRRGASELVTVLRDADPTTPVFSWSANKTIGFIPRRMAQETLIHRWDAQNATTLPHAFDPELAADGIHEFLTIFTPAEEKPAGFDGAIALHATDLDRTWTALAKKGKVGLGEPAPARASIEATAESILLCLWGRIPLGDLTVTGDKDLASALVAYADLS